MTDCQNTPKKTQISEKTSYFFKNINEKKKKKI